MTRKGNSCSLCVKKFVNKKKIKIDQERNDKNSFIPPNSKTLTGV